MLFKGGKSIAHATSHKLTVTGKVTSTSDKDGGLWNNGEITGLSWEITSDNLYTVAEYDSLFKSLVAGTQVDIIFGIPSDYDINGLAAEDAGDEGGWTAPAPAPQPYPGWASASGPYRRTAGCPGSGPSPSRPR